MRTSLATLALAAVLGAPTYADDYHEGWFQDFDEAAAAAKEQGKDLFVDFTGSDWCGWCIKLGDEVFQHEEFRGPIMEDYVLVMLDFPRDPEIKAKVPNPERNRELADKYRVGGYPTILLMTAEGDVYGQTGYQAGGPAKYVEHVNELRAEGRPALEEVLELVARFDEAEDEKREAVWQLVVLKLEELGGDSPFAGVLADPVKAAFEFDPENERGLMLRAVEVLLAAGLMDDDVTDAVHQLDPTNEKGLLEQAVEAQVYAVGSKEDVEAACAAIVALSEGAGIQDSDREVFLYANAAYWFANVLADPDQAKVMARLSKEAGAEGRTLDMLNQILGE